MRLTNKSNLRNTLKRIFFLSLLAIIASIPQASAQELDSEAGFIYLKAKYLYETDRYDDAIREFNKVIKQIADYEDAMVLRAKSKFALAAYKGAELDALEYIKLKGITPDVSLILGESQHALENFEAAKNTLVTAVQLNPNNAEPLEILAKMAQSEGELLSACAYWSTAAKLGSSKAKANAKRYCGEIIEPEIEKVPKKEEEDIISIGTKEEDTTDPATDEGVDDDDDGVISVGTRVEKEDSKVEDSSTVDPSDSKQEGETRELDITKVQKPWGSDENDEKIDENKEDGDITKVEVEKVEEVKKEYDELLDDTSNDIVVDEDLTLHIYGQGLGKREIVQTPNILILSEDDGKVAIDICVNRQGRVESADFNSDLSTIGKKSLISLAIRKSKDFWFAKNTKYKEQCGVIIFDIKGS